MTSETPSENRWETSIGRGVVLLILGILFLIFTLSGVIALSIIAGCALLIFGLAMLAEGIKNIKCHGALYIVLGILVAILGILAIANWEFFAIFAAYLIAVISLFIGIYAIIVGISGNAPSGNRAANIILGIVAILFAISIFVLKAFAPAFIVTVIGIFLIIYGILIIVRGASSKKKNAEIKS